MRLFNSFLFTFAMFGFWIGFHLIPSLESYPPWLPLAVIAFSFGVVGSTVHKFFADVTDIATALKKR